MVVFSPILFKPFPTCRFSTLFPKETRKRTSTLHTHNSEGLWPSRAPARALSGQALEGGPEAGARERGEGAAHRREAAGVGEPGLDRLGGLGRFEPTVFVGFALAGDLEAVSGSFEMPGTRKQFWKAPLARYSRPASSLPATLEGMPPLTRPTPVQS